MKRRDFITLLGGAAAWPLAARAQQPDRMPLIGIISWSSENDPEAQRLIAVFKKGLQDFGWIEGRNIEFDLRWPAADPGRIRAHTVDLIGKKPSVILVNNTPATRVLNQETRTVPVVFVSIADPVRTGLVASLTNPGGNLTGLINFEATMGGKWLGLLKEIAPDTRRAGLLFNPSTHSGQYFGLIETAARSLGMELVQLPVQDAVGIDRVAAALAGEGNAGLIIMPDAFTYVHRDRIVASAMQHHLPAMYPFRFFVAAGGLISYGFDEADLYRRAASFVDRILRGAKPASIPVELPTKFEFVVNLRTAKKLGLKIPRIIFAARRRGDRMKRREFITLLGGAAAACPLAVRAQQPSKTAKVGILYPGTAAALPSRLAGLREGLQAAGCHCRASGSINRRISDSPSPTGRAPTENQYPSIGRWLYPLWRRSSEQLSSGCSPGRQGAARRQACRVARRIADEVRAYRQHEDGKKFRNYVPDIAPSARRRGD